MNNSMLAHCVMALALLGGCDALQLTQDFDGEFEITLDLPDNCPPGNTTTTDASGVSMLTLSETSSGSCQIEFEWEGPLLDTATISDEIESRSGGVVSGITVTDMTGQLTGIALLDGENGPVSPPLIEAFSAEASINGAQVISVPNATVLLSAPVAMAASDVVLRAVETALNNSTSLQGSGEGILTISAADYATLAAVDGLKLSFSTSGSVMVTIMTGIP